MIYKYLVFIFVLVVSTGILGAEGDQKEERPRFTAPAAGKVKIFYLPEEEYKPPPQKERGKGTTSTSATGEVSCDCPGYPEDEWVPKYGFFNVSIGKQKYSSELTGGTLNPFLLGLSGGSLQLVNNELAWKWFLGADYGKKKFSKETDAFFNTFFGVDVVVFMGTQLASFNVGPVFGLNFMKFEGVNGDGSVLNEKTTSFSVGYDLGFSFFPTRDLTIDVGRRMYFPVINGDVEGDNKENVSNALDNIRQFYFSVGFWM